MDPNCAFCTRIRDGGDLGPVNELAVAFADAYPVTPGHTLIVSRRHVERLGELEPEEANALWSLVAVVREWIETSHSPHGYNLGLNDGATAGQTVPHVHLHVIPRYMGDVPDPRGGVRWLIPERAAYWERTGGGG